MTKFNKKDICMWGDKCEKCCGCCSFFDPLEECDDDCWDMCAFKEEWEEYLEYCRGEERGE